MRTRIRALLVLAALLPVTAQAQLSEDSLPGDTVWYFHLDLDAIRASEAGAILSAWFEEEVADEVRDETGIDLSEELDAITAFADGANNTVIVADGDFSRETQDKLLAIAASEGPVDPREFDGKTYYFYGDEEDIDDPADEPFEDLEDAVFLSFAVPGKAIVAGTEDVIQTLLENGGDITGSGSHDSAVFVMTASKPLLQAGMQPAGLVDADDYDDGDDWESRVVSNTEQAALLMADESGQFAVEAQLVSKDPKMAEAIAGIVNGLIALQAFNPEFGPEYQELIQNTKVEVRDNILSINTVIAPELVQTIMDH